MKYFLIAGEVSGDKHGARLAEQIRLRDNNARLVALGGDEMVAAGCSLYRHIRHMAFMGFAAVIRNKKEVRANFRIARKALLKEQPDVLVLIDYPSFNLRMAAFCRRHLPDTKIYYYIPPKVWAWKRRRIHRIARLCDQVFGIFPFEPEFYSRYGYACTYVGNPTAEEIGQYKIANSHSALPSKPFVALLPGSRQSEIEHCLPVMLEAARRVEGYSIVVTAAPGMADCCYTPYLRAGERLTRDTYDALHNAQAAIVNSGTATLEAALLGCPQVAVYHLACARLIGLIRWVVQPLLFSIPYFTLVNIIAGREVIKECVANDFKAAKIEKELKRLLTDDTYKKNMLASYEHIQSLLGPSSAASTAADLITSKQQVPPARKAVRQPARLC